MPEATLQKKKVTQILQSLAAAYLANHQYDIALEKFRQLQSLSSDEPVICRGLATAFLGLRHTTEEAQRHYLHFCTLFPEDHELVSKIAELLLHAHIRSEAAFHIYRCAIAFHPPFEKDLHLLLLEAFEHAGDTALALQAARSAALLPGSDVKAVRKLISLSWQQHRLDELIEELKALPERPALPDDIKLFIALSLAHHSLHKKGMLSSKEIRTIKHAARNLLPINTIRRARDYCTLLLAMAYSERPQRQLAEATPKLLNNLDGVEIAGYHSAGNLSTSAKDKPGDFLREFIRQINGKGAHAQAAATIDLIRNTGEIIFLDQASAVMVVALHPEPPFADERPAPFKGESALQSLSAISTALQSQGTAQVRLFEDGLLAVAQSPERLMEITIACLRKLASENSALPRAFVHPLILIHAIPIEIADEPLSAFNLLHTALQLAGSMPLQRDERAGEVHQAIDRTRLFVTQEALDLMEKDADFVLSRRQVFPAGVAGAAINVREAHWRDPFEFATEKQPVIVGRFAVVEKLHDTDASSTYVARDRELNVKAVLKSLSRRRLQQVHGEQFMKEILRVGKLSHPALALIHDMGECDGVFYFIREFVEGHSLREADRIVDLQSMSQILTRGLQACRALHYAHREGVFHLNLKPTNFWITTDGEIKLTDFRLAAFHDTATALEEESDNEVYLAPEIRRSSAGSAASDVYSLAALLFLMICHEPPPESKNKDIVERLRFLPDQKLPEPIGEVLFRALSHDSGERPQSIVEFGRELRQVLAMLPAPSMPISA